MMRIFYILIFVGLFTSCKPANERRCLKQNGNLISKTIFDIDASKVILYDDIALVLVEDSMNYIEIKGPENIVPFVDITIDNSVLTLENKNICNFTRNKKELSVYYHCTNVDSIQLNGFGDLSNLGEYSKNLFIGSYESFSSIKLNLNNEFTNITAQVGSIDAKLTGKCSNLYMYSNGSGFMDASEIECVHSHGHSQGIGDFYLRATNEIGIELRNRGNFYVYESENATKSIVDEGEGEVLFK